MQTNDPRLRHAIRVKCRNDVFGGDSGYLFSRCALRGTLHSEKPDPEGWFFYPYGDTQLGLSQYYNSIAASWDTLEEAGYWRSDAGWVGIPVSLAEVEYLDKGLSNEVDEVKLPRRRRGRRRGRPHKMRLRQVTYETE